MRTARERQEERRKEERRVKVKKVESAWKRLKKKGGDRKERGESVTSNRLVGHHHLDELLCR